MLRRAKPNWRAVKIHRNYTVDELARTVGVAKATVRRWCKSGLPHLTDQKPTLILGHDALEFHRVSKPKKQKCGPGELYCVKCRMPRAPLNNEVEYVPLKSNGGNLRGLCEECTTVMHRRTSASALKAAIEQFEVLFPLGVPNLMDTQLPSSNVHLAKEPITNG